MTSAVPLVPSAWRPRSIPLTPAAIAARGQAARRLAERLLSEPHEGLRCGTFGDHLLLVGHAAGELWVDGALYLGHDAAAPSLLLPTALEPDVPLPLWERALRTNAGLKEMPLAVLPSWRQLWRLDGLGPLNADRLREWLDKEASHE